MNKEKLRRHTPLIIGAVSFAYYVALSAKSYTWVFVSEDAADWLAASNWWMVPQPLGSPVYITLGHFLNLFPGDLVIKMTVLLSCLPSAITVALVYLIVRKLTANRWAAFGASGMLLGAAVFLTQSTVLEEYALATMFLTLGFYLYTIGKTRWSGASLGLACAVHAFLLPVVGLWFLIEFRRRRENAKAIPAFVACGILPYLLIIGLMWMDTPRFMSGGLGVASLKEYVVGVTSTIGGTLSVFDLPDRLSQFVPIVCASMGLGWLALWRGWKSEWTREKRILVLIIAFTLGFYFTCLFYTAWVFLAFAAPAVAVLVGVGLNKLHLNHSKIVLCGAAVLLVVNGVFLNANTLTNENPVASTLYNEIMELPDGAVVVGTPRYTWTAIYAMSDGKDVVPVIAGYTDYEFKFTGYQNYLKERWDLEGKGTLGLIEDAWSQGRPVYFSGVDRDPTQRSIERCFHLNGEGLVQEITGLTGLPFPSLSEVSFLEEEPW